jgi:hypothetical protein
MADDPNELAHTLLPLPLACEVIFERVYSQPPTHLGREELLNSIAATIATVAPIFEYRTDSETVVRRLSTADLTGGTFQRAGKELCFADGRKARVSLAVSAEDIEAVVARLKRI